MIRLRRLLLGIGLGFTYAGVLLLSGGWLAGFTNSNLYLLSCLVLILSGIVLYVIRVKGESKY